MHTYFSLTAFFRGPGSSTKILYLLLFLMFLYLMSIALSPLHKMKEFEKQVQSDSLFISEFNHTWSHPELAALVRKKAGKEGLIKLSEKDSIHLAVNLSDSTVCLYIKGVKLHQTHIKRFEMNELLKNLPAMQYAFIYSKPLPISSQYATIVKEPVVVRQAPRDAEEAEQNAWQPDTLVQNPAFLHLRLEQGIDLVLEQEANQGFHNKWVKLKFHFRIWSRDKLKTIKRFVAFQKQEYHPRIKITMPEDDLRAIYRALPQQAYLVLIF